MVLNRFTRRALDHLERCIEATEDIEAIALFIEYDEDGYVDQDVFPNTHKGHVACAIELVDAAREPEANLDCVRGLAIRLWVGKEKTLPSRLSVRAGM